MAIAGDSTELTVQPYTKTVRVEIFTEGSPEDYYICVHRQDGFLMPDGKFSTQGPWRRLTIKPSKLPTLAQYTQLPEWLEQRLMQPLSIVELLELLPVLVSLAGDALDLQFQAEVETQTVSPPFS